MLVVQRFFQQADKGSDLEICGRNALITGSAIRLGRAVALALAEAGMNVAVHYGHSQAKAEQTRDQLEQFAVKNVIIQADFTNPVEAARKLFAEANDQLGAINVLINSAAIFEAGTLHDVDESHWDRHHDINLKAPFFLAQAFVKQLPAEQRGHIINIADRRATRPVTGHIAYTITKAGLVIMTKILALELAPQIQVNAIAPGAILPPPGEPDSYLERIARQIPLKRTGNPTEITNAIRFLLNAEFITGEVLHVDGGEHL